MLIQLLTTESSGDVQRQILTTLCNIAKNGNRNRLATVAAGALAPLLTFLTKESDDDSTKELSIEIIANLAVEDTNKEAIRNIGMLPLLCGFLSNSKLQKAAIRALSHLTVNGIDFM